MKKLAEIVLWTIEYLELAEDKGLDPDLAIKYLEGIGGLLNDGTKEEREAVRQAAREKLAWYGTFPDEYGYRPRMSEELRELLAGVASGFLWDGPGEEGLGTGGR
jgi:hypothetical protein